MRQPDVKWEAVKNRGWRLDYGAAAPQGRVLSGQMAESRCWTDSGKSGKRGAHMSLKCIGIDIGGTSVKLGIFEEDGTLGKEVGDSDKKRGERKVYPGRYCGFDPQNGKGKRSGAL